MNSSADYCLFDPMIFYIWQNEHLNLIYFRTSFFLFSPETSLKPWI